LLTYIDLELEPGMTGLSATFDAIWTAQRRWSRAADDANRQVAISRGLNLILLALGAGLAVAAAQTWLLTERGQVWVTLLGSGVLVAAIVIQRRLLASIFRNGRTVIFGARC
jgi:hypothetical protein